MTNSTVIDVLDYSKWGIEAKGGRLYIGSPSDFSSLRRDFPWVFDVENDSDGSCAGIGITTDGRDVYFFEPSTVSLLARDCFHNIKLVAHNAKYDVQMLRRWGFDVSPDQIYWDTALAEYVKDSTTNEYSLKDLAKKRYRATYPEFKELVGTGKKRVEFSSLPLAVKSQYNGCDVFYTHKLLKDQIVKMTYEQVHYMQTIELPCMRVLLEMEERGVQIDANYIRSLDDGIAAGIERTVSQIRTVASDDINLNSYQQIKQLLLDKAGLKVQSTDAKTLKNHADLPLVKDILRYRELKKLKGTYTEVLLEEAHGQETYRLHARFNQIVTHTGRLSSSSPNLQNIPSRTDEGDAIRRGFVRAGDREFIDADYSQIEPRLMAHFSQDAELLAIFREGRDLYDSVSVAAGMEATKESRKISKVLWLAMAYNAGAGTIAHAANITVDQAETFLRNMKKTFRTFFYWCQRVTSQASIDRGITTLFGRFIPMDDFVPAPNYMIQGSAAEINKLGLIATRSFSPVLNVHDEVLYETRPENMAEIVRRLETVVTLTVPIKVEAGTGSNWSEAKK